MVGEVITFGVHQGECIIECDIRAFMDHYVHFLRSGIKLYDPYLISNIGGEIDLTN